METLKGKQNWIVILSHSTAPPLPPRELCPGIFLCGVEVICFCRPDAGAQHASLAAQGGHTCGHREPQACRSEQHRALSTYKAGEQGSISCQRGWAEGS